jgi:Glyoxalase-like domain
MLRFYSLRHRAESAENGTPTRWYNAHRVRTKLMVAVSRRLFLAVAAGALAAPRWLRAEDQVPSNLDHILLGVSDLEYGIAWVEKRTGVRAVFGGVHPGRGTRNALLSLGPRCYLEIIAPDPKQPVATSGPAKDVMEMREPRLFNWAVHTDDIAAAARRAVAAGFAIDGPADGSRTRPDGKILQWKACRLKDDRGGLLPFFIEWSRASVHPATDAPGGCAVKRFSVKSPSAPNLAGQCHMLGLEVAVEYAEKPALDVVLATPRGEVEL